MLKLLGLVVIGSLIGAGLGYFGQCADGTCPLTANWRRGALVGGLLALVLGASIFHSSDEGLDVDSEMKSDGKNTARVDSEGRFEEIVVGPGGVVLVDFYATWCGPCKRLSPVIDVIADRFAGEAVVAKVDVDKVPALAKRFDVRGVPCVVLFKDGVEIDRFVGAEKLDFYARALREALPSTAGGTSGAGSGAAASAKSTK